MYDLRSDTLTKPTDEMFEVMKAASRGDDVWGEDDSVQSLESHVASLCGHEAGLYCASGTMTNQIAIRTHLTQPPHSVVCDARSHVYNYEAGGIPYHSQAHPIPVHPANKHHLTLADVKNAAILNDDIHYSYTKLICLENTLDGTIFPLEDMAAISGFAREHDLKVHLDGARLWNASIATGIPLSEYGKHVDSISLCLSKGLGAPIGSVLVGSAAFIRRARHFRKLFGGGWRQAGSLAAVGSWCIEHVWPTMAHTHALAKSLSQGLEDAGCRIYVPTETNMVFVDPKPIGCTIDDLKDKLEKVGVKITYDRLVLHWQIDEKAVNAILKAVKELAEEKRGQKLEAGNDVAGSSYPLKN